MRDEEYAHEIKKNLRTRLAKAASESKYDFIAQMHYCEAGYGDLCIQDTRNRISCNILPHIRGPLIHDP